jgi:hypothetical protein
VDSAGICEGDARKQVRAGLVVAVAGVTTATHSVAIRAEASFVLVARRRKNHRRKKIRETNVTKCDEIGRMM